MITHIEIWQTLNEAMIFVKTHLGLFLKGLALPLVLFIVINIPLAMVQSSLIIIPLLQTLILIWMINICYRIVLTGSPGKMWWSMTETRTFMWMILISFLITIGAGIPAALIYFGLSIFKITPFMVSIIIASIVYTFGLWYLMARLSLIFPGLAMGEKVSLEKTWNNTQENGGTLMILFGLIPIIVMGVILLIGLVVHFLLMPLTSEILQDDILIVVIQTVSALLFCLTSTVVAFAYKKLMEPNH